MYEERDKLYGKFLRKIDDIELADAAPLTPDQIEARLISAIEVSRDEQRELIKQRAQAVQSFILQDGKVTAERLFIVTPKSAGAAAKGESRVNLSLS